MNKLSEEKASENTIYPLRLKKINLTNFRNYAKLELNLDSDVIFITGENGSGKTSILEAVSLASVLRSFRKSSDKDMILWDNSYYSINIEYNDKGGGQKLHIGYGKTSESDNEKISRHLKYNSEKLTRVSDFVGKFQTIVFSPNDIDIVDTSLTERRRFVDITLSSLNSQYMKSLQNYRKTLQVRTALLKEHKYKPLDKIYFRSIDMELAKDAVFIQKKRKEFIIEFQKHFEKYVFEISNNKDNWIISYEPSVKKAETENDYIDEIESRLSEDIRKLRTTKGIHLDQINFHPAHNLNLEIRRIASQGQKRTAALALKMAQFSYARQLSHKTPVCLIDDVLTELDEQRRISFIKFLSEIGQAIITSAHIKDMNYLKEKIGLKNKVTVYQLSNGLIHTLD
ncbi:MAG: DNA replication and repair protein RecF [Spirochaetia bacterium]|nr:DNA replication and repair protein RecF [Spirochaetia bacterium]